MDVLTDLLQRSRARGAAFSHTEVHGEWGITYAAIDGLAVHGVLGGEAHLWTDATSIHLLPGDLSVVRGGVEHHMGRTPGVPTVPFMSIAQPGPPGAPSMRIAVDGDGPATTYFCGAYLFEGDLAAGLLDALPEVTHLRPGAGSSLRATMDLLSGEVLHLAPGQQALLDRLLDVALVQILRTQLAADTSAAPGWFRAMGDPQIGAALRALHADPARNWTVADLAREASLSRATFARRFTELLGTAPLAYLIDWRMALAREQLRDSDAGLAAIARELGYASEFSFAAAFKRHQGVAPGRWRAASRAEAA
jgi:AraC-like DNA-binding protein